MKKKLVVVGNGMVGARLVEDVLARGGRDTFDVVVFGDEPRGNYNRILLSSVLVGSHDEEDIFLNPLAWYHDAGVTLRAGERVTGVDRERRVVVSENGREEPYDALVLATGSVPFLPPIEGLAGDGALPGGVHVFRTLDDARAMIEASASAPRAVVIGGGLLGLEAARGLLARGASVTVVHLVDHLMEVQLDASAAGILRRALEETGLSVRTRAATKRLLVEGGHVRGVELEGGEILPCELVVVTAGIRPNTALARACGLTVRRGIVVGDDLATVDDPSVYAIGECSEHAGVTYGLVAPLWEQAQVLAERLMGKDARYAGSQTATKLKVAEVELAVMGDRDPKDADDEVVTYAEPSRGVYKKLILRDRRIAGAMLLGDASRAADLFQAFSRRAIVAQRPSELLFPAASAAAAPRAADLPDDAQICNCNGVSKGEIVSAIDGGARTLRGLCERTRAGLGCGSCKEHVQEILEASCDGGAEDPSVHWYTPAVPLTKPDLVRAIKERDLRSVSAVLRELGSGRDDAASKPALASLLRTIWGADYDDERDARFINDRVHANIQRDGTFSVVPRIYGGVVSPAELRRIAETAERHGAQLVKLTGGQRIDLLGIPKENLPAVWRDLGMPSGHAYSKAVRTCKTCVGTHFCRYGVGDSIGLGIALERRLQGIEAPHKVKLATAGCPRNCSEATTKDIGAVAIEGGRWEIHVGGAAGSKVRKADVLCVVSTHDEVLRMSGRFLQYYRENARYMERSYDFVARVGIERLRALLVDDIEGEAARLDAEIERAANAYEDPWEEAAAPVHPSQFRDVVHVVDAPPEPEESRVEVRRAV